ncbi:trypsin-like serine protease [Conexibacter sp. JD483]|uniref:trypsin-like serine protease n=1 Tax=unclassified Conexibacter TaxID=2627773 RepID=UPI00271A6B54|nr:MULTISPECIES: trypsin-like serine protease [unclassified Conexibacter]MDO8187605.1 trypsin-like serine protease [Conexibacter sp. CPCC 205706]MDO8201063.1 trypsin-like serine protease [Conexibacter sp. CPCC 205762]MDR9371832.1 trypsin-like serine protease [Conexibacter sp. JD483]
MHEPKARIPGRRTAVALVSLAALLLAAPATQASEGTLRLGPQTEVGKKPAIVGGNPISITQAPHQIFLIAEDAVTRSTYICGGSILDSTHVVTAGHCVYNARTVRPFDASELTVVAGISNFRTPESTRQPSGVAAVRIHPGYAYTAENGGVAPDDVAVLTLSRTLDLSGPAARAISLVDAGAYSPQGTPAGISGFGLQAGGAASPDGQLYAVGTTIGDPLACGSDVNAVITCIASQVGSACEGDSGGPLTVGTVLAGVASFVSTNGPSGECGVGSVNGYSNLAAGEIRDFVLGNDAPPVAPRGGRDVSARGFFQSGSSMECSAGTWSGAPTFTYTFVDTRNGQVLQSGASATYAFTDADVGRTVACQPAATNAGGTGITRTEASPAIAVNPNPPRRDPTPTPNPTPRRPTPTPRRPAAKKPSLRLSVKASTTRVRPGATVTYTIKVANRGTGPAGKVVVCDAPGKGLAFSSLPKGAKKSRGSACWTLGTLKADSSRTLKVTLRVSGSASNGALLRNGIGLASGNGGRRAASPGVRVAAAQQRGATRPPAVTG